MNQRDYPTPSLYTPFDSCAAARQKHMGLLTAEGSPNKETAAVIARMYAGLLYDNLLDHYADPDVSTSVCRRLVEGFSSASVKEQFLSICSAYDCIYRDLPEPVWWMAGNLELVSYFTDSFLRRLAELMGAEVTSPCVQ